MFASVFQVDFTLTFITTFGASKVKVYCGGSSILVISANHDYFSYFFTLPAGKMKMVCVIENWDKESGRTD